MSRAIDEWLLFLACKSSNVSAMRKQVFLLPICVEMLVWRCNNLLVSVLTVGSYRKFSSKVQWFLKMTPYFALPSFNRAINSSMKFVHLLRMTWHFLLPFCILQHYRLSHSKYFPSRLMDYQNSNYYKYFFIRKHAFNKTLIHDVPNSKFLRTN